MALNLTGESTVFTRKNSLLRRRNRAVTLIEAVLYISIALALIVGGLVFFQQASTAAKTSALVRQLSATLAEGRVQIKGTPFTDMSRRISVPI
jgi:cell division protein FtsL